MVPKEEVYPEACQITKIELFAIIVKTGKKRCLKEMLKVLLDPTLV